MTYTPTDHSTVKDKEKFARHFRRFIRSGYKWTLFHKWFYKRLSMMFGHIAHYDRSGFYITQFQHGDKIKAWEKRIMYGKAYGEPAYTWSDVESDLSVWLSKKNSVEVSEHERMIILG